MKLLLAILGLVLIYSPAVHGYGQLIAEFGRNIAPFFKTAADSYVAVVNFLANADAEHNPDQVALEMNCKAVSQYDALQEIFQNGKTLIDHVENYRKINQEYADQLAQEGNRLRMEKTILEEQRDEIKARMENATGPVRQVLQEELDRITGKLQITSRQLGINLRDWSMYNGVVQVTNQMYNSMRFIVESASETQGYLSVFDFRNAGEHLSAISTMSTPLTPRNKPLPIDNIPDDVRGQAQVNVAVLRSKLGSLKLDHRQSC